jgi:hypothetical protein
MWQQEVNRTVLGSVTVAPRTALATLVSRQAAVAVSKESTAKDVRLKRKSTPTSAPAKHRRLDSPDYPPPSGGNLRYTRPELGQVLSTFGERSRKKVYEDMVRRKYVLRPGQPHGVKWGSIRRVVLEWESHAEGRGPPPRGWGFYKQGRRPSMESTEFNRVADEAKAIRPATFGTSEYQKILRKSMGGATVISGKRCRRGFDGGRAQLSESKTGTQIRGREFSAARILAGLLHWCRPLQPWSAPT